jgi:hypothetical protein
MLAGGMRWLVLLSLCGCNTAHIDLRFELLQGQTDCQSIPGNPPAPATCEQLTLDCADHLLLRVRDVSDNIISSRCITLQDEPDLCALEKLKDPISLIDSVPSGTTFYFQLAALHYNPATGTKPKTQSCDDEINPPVRVFTGNSQPVLVDGKSHTLDLMLTNCGSCANLPGEGAPDLGAHPLSDLGQQANDMSFASDGGVSQDLAPPADGGTVQDLALIVDLTQPQCVNDWSSIGGGSCCPATSSSCLAPGSDCGHGVGAQLPPGGCCAICD